MAHLDDRLDRIENRIEILLERQRLSRFDNLMFLMYPVVIFSMTLLLTLSLQYATIETMSFLGMPMVVWLEIVRVGLLLGLGLTFLHFCIAYAKDNQGMRLTSLENLVSVLAGLTLAISVLFLSSWKVVLLPVISTNVRFVATFPFVYASFLLLLEGRVRLMGWVASWFEKSLPVTLEQSHVVLKTWHVVARHRSMVKASWSVGLAAYLVVFVVAIWKGELTSRLAYDAWYIIVFLLTTEAIVLWRL